MNEGRLDNLLQFKTNNIENIMSKGGVRMKKTKDEKSSWKFHHFGAVVEDLEKAIVHFEDLGIGPFTPNPSEGVKERKVYGKTADIKLKGAVTKLGPLEFELIQPVRGKSVQKVFLDTKGEGINHIGFIVQDLEKEVARLEQMGFAAISTGRIPDNGGFAYFKTDSVGGVFIELIEPPAD